jgi:hypothetical protein
MSWHYSQALEEAYLAASCSGGNASAPSNTNPPQGECSPHAKTTDVSTPSPYGTMCEPSTGSHGVDWWMSSLAASRARISPPLEKARDSTANEAASGLKCLGSLARFDLDTRLWKTHQFSLLGGLEPFSETWPRWGMMRGGECWELSTPELRTSENESGLWRSPAAHEPGVTITRLETRSGEPVGSMCRHYDKHTGRMAQIGLTQQVQARMWPTPSTKGLDGGSNSRKAAKERGMWPTPRAGTDTMCGGSGHKAMLKGTDLEKGRGGQLNPTWVEWLMGWPLGWTDSAQSVTDKFRQWCASHGIS